MPRDLKIIFKIQTRLSQYCKVQNGAWWLTLYVIDCIDTEINIRLTVGCVCIVTTIQCVKDKEDFISNVENKSFFQKKRRGFNKDTTSVFKLFCKKTLVTWNCGILTETQICQWQNPSSWMLSFVVIQNQMQCLLSNSLTLFLFIFGCSWSCSFPDCFQTSRLFWTGVMVLKIFYPQCCNLANSGLLIGSWIQGHNSAVVLAVVHYPFIPGQVKRYIQQVSTAAKWPTWLPQTLTSNLSLRWLTVKPSVCVWNPH